MQGNHCETKEIKKKGHFEVADREGNSSLEIVFLLLYSGRGTWKFSE